MNSSKKIVDNVHSSLSVSLPVALASAGLADFDDYVNGTPYDADRKQCCIYSGQVSYSETTLEREIIVQMSLPREMGPLEYAESVEETVFGLDAHTVAGALTKRYDVTTWYPNELQSGQSAFILYSLKYTEELDVCDQY